MRAFPAVISLALTCHAAAQVRVGGFDDSRGGGMNLATGQYLSTIRNAISHACIGPTVLSGSTTLSPEYLAGIDVLIVASPEPFRPRSTRSHRASSRPWSSSF